MDESIRKVAVLVAALDPRSADALLDRIDTDRARRIRDAVMQLDPVSESEESQVLADFLQSGNRPDGANLGGVELDPSLQRRLAEPPENWSTASREAPSADEQPFRFLKEATVDTLASYLESESSQVVAVVAAHLPPARAAELIQRFHPQRQVDILRRVAEFDRTDAEAILELEECIQVALAEEIRAVKNRESGIAAVASILAAAGKNANQLTANLVKFDRDFAGWLGTSRAAVPGDNHEAGSVQARPESPTGSVPPTPQPRRSIARPSAQPLIQHREPPIMETTEAFGRLSELPESRLLELFSRVPREILLLALAGAPQRLVDKLLSHTPGRQRRGILGEISKLGPVRLSDIAEAQRRVLNLAL